MTTTIPALLLHFVGLPLQCTTCARQIGNDAQPPQDKNVESLGGYRLVRRLGVGSRSDVWLGSDGAETSAIKVFRDGVGSELVDAEIEALGRASHRHLLRLEDLAMAPNGMPCMILQRLSPWNLGRVLSRVRPSDGEAVTILAPLCLAVAELHRVGVSHGRIRAASVLFDDAGAPVLASFGAAELFGPMPDDPAFFSVPAAQLEHVDSVANDVDALTNLCLSVLRPDSETARWLVSSPACESRAFLQELADRLFRHAVAAPVDFANPETSDATARIPLRMSGTAGAPQQKDGQSGARREVHSEQIQCGSEASATGRAARVSALMHLPDGLVAGLFDAGGVFAEHSPISMMVQRIKDALRPVRRPVWIFAGIVTACVVVAVTVMPTGAGGEPRHEVPGPAASPTVRSSTASELSVVTGDDPLAAASALLDARSECVVALSVLCLDSVDQRGSAAMQSDVAHVRLMQEGGADNGYPLVASTLPQALSVPRSLDLVERLGDSALLSVSFGDEDAAEASFSLLLIKQDGGWRIRDLTPVVESSY